MFPRGQDPKGMYAKCITDLAWKTGNETIMGGVTITLCTHGMRLQIVDHTNKTTSCRVFFLSGT